MKNRKKAKAGKLGGSARTKAKRLAAIRNGAKGGRPCKTQASGGKIPMEKPGFPLTPGSGKPL